MIKIIPGNDQYNTLMPDHDTHIFIILYRQKYLTR